MEGTVAELKSSNGEDIEPGCRTPSANDMIWNRKE